jgi:hypothetical protein
MDSLLIPTESRTPVSWMRVLAHMVRMSERMAMLTISAIIKMVDTSSDNCSKEDAAFS